jgi:osmotically-inducible protein OsmY
MSGKSIVMKLTLLFSLMLVFVASSVAGRGVSAKQRTTQSRQPVDCTAVTDDQIRDEIIEALKKKFTKTSDQERFSFNPRVANKVVRLTGGVQGTKLYLDVILVVRSIKSFNCVAGFDIASFRPARGQSCNEMTQDVCNGECIEKGAPCVPIFR